MRRYQQRNLMDACVNFDMSRGQSDNVAFYLGRKRFGDGYPQTGKYIKQRHCKFLMLIVSHSPVVISLQSLNHDPADTAAKVSAGNIRDPPA